MVNSSKIGNRVVNWTLVVLLCLLGSILAFHLFSFSELSHRLFAKRVNHLVLRESDRLQQSKVDLLYAFDQWNYNGALPPSVNQLPSGIQLYVFHNDSLVYWNSNLVEPKLLRKKTLNTCDTIVNLNVGDFLVSTDSYGSYSFFLFSLLNTTYPVENENFINTFQATVGHHRVAFSPEETAGSFPLYGRSGELLSYFTIPQASVWESSNLSLLIASLALFVLVAFLLLIRALSRRLGQLHLPEKPYSFWVCLIPILFYTGLFVGVVLASEALFKELFKHGFFIPEVFRLDQNFLYLFFLGLALITLVLLLRRLFQRFFYTTQSPWLQLLAFVVLFLATTLFMGFQWLTVVLGVVIFLLMWFFPEYHARGEVLSLVLQFILWGVLLTHLYDQEYTRDENSHLQALSEELSDEHDPVFERSYQAFLQEAENDTVFYDMVQSDDIMEVVAEDYMRSFLFDSVMQAYDFSLTLCTPTLELVVQPYDIVTGCHSYFMDRIQEAHGEDMGNGLYFIDDNTLDPSYLGYFSLDDDDAPAPKTLYLEFRKPVAPKGFGLPKLLQDEHSLFPMNFSVASYRDSLLVYKYGSYVYPNYLSDYRHPINAFSYGRRLKHWVYQADAHKVLAITVPRRGWMEATSPFVVFFLMLIIPFLLVYFVGDLRRNRPVSVTLRSRFQMMVLLALGLSFLIIGPVSVLYMRGFYNQKSSVFHFERTRTLLLDITSVVEFNFLKQPGYRAVLDEVLGHYSEIFFTDINIYGLNGKLLASTSPEILEMHLQSSLMNAEAFHNMQGEKMLYFTHEEILGQAVYQSAYMSIQDGSGKTLAYLNTPYFGSQSDLRSEILYYVLTYINIILLIVFLFVPIILVLTRRVTYPLVQLQEKMRRIDINKSNEPLQWNSKDEIGDLVNQYNQLVVALEKSAAELRRTTTESAWRGVARQVAHEIKNSLTPMRLSVQMLQRNIENGNATPEQMQRTTNTLIEQIDALSDIASSFSTYAKLPENHPQPLDLAELVGNVVNLYDNADNITFHYLCDPSESYIFNGDKTNLNSAIGNVIKNAVQAIGSKPDGRIDVKLESTETAFVVSVQDNGKGIKEEDKKMIFLPNFTTKTGGSGVGLSLTYNIVQAAGGTITFESQEGEGTVFVITLPK